MANDPNSVYAESDPIIAAIKTNSPLLRTLELAAQ